MKKLFIGLLALAMVFGFAGCNKDAETNEWTDTTVYLIYEEYGNDDWAYTDFSFTKPADDVSYEAVPCFVKKDSGIKRCTQREYFEYEDGAYKDGELAPDEYLFEFEEKTFESLTNDWVDCFKLEGYLIITKWGLAGPYEYSLTVPEELDGKEIWTFDDGSTLTIYFKLNMVM
ncbi:MAG: hypothetical protein IKX23_06660 [Treponema sp.]|nr:hypothetical protein [Treponema sp.]